LIKGKIILFVGSLCFCFRLFLLHDIVFAFSFALIQKNSRRVGMFQKNQGKFAADRLADRQAGLIAPARSDKRAAMILSR
jgi:hypothetical protein